jgi:hypothetical protein
MWESTRDETKLYRVWHPTTSMYGTHIDVWDWTTKSRINNSFLDTLQAACQSELDDTAEDFSW